MAYFEEWEGFVLFFDEQTIIKVTKKQQERQKHNVHKSPQLYNLSFSLSHILVFK